MLHLFTRTTTIGIIEKLYAAQASASASALKVTLYRLPKEQKDESQNGAGDATRDVNDAADAEQNQWVQSLRISFQRGSARTF